MNYNPCLELLVRAIAGPLPMAVSEPQAIENLRALDAKGLVVATFSRLDGSSSSGKVAAATVTAVTALGQSLGADYLRWHAHRGAAAMNSKPRRPDPQIMD